MYDIIVIGSGPAGISAAITAKMRGRRVFNVSNSRTQSGLYKAREINNYPGLAAISGAELSSRLTAHAGGMGIDHMTGRVTGILRTDDLISCSFGETAMSAKTLVLALGIVQNSVFPGEAELLGNGVSYCVTCDGMLYKGKKVCVAALSPDAEHEIAFLSSIGCEVVTLKTKNISVRGSGGAVTVTADGEDIDCACAFILRHSVAPDTLLPGLGIEDGVIAVDRNMKTNLPGVFAAGDCVGAPYQVAKAVGQGQIAALSADEYIGNT
jgi:thioredoxin reductase (NADPH)